ESNWQIRRIRALHVIAEGQLIDENMVVGRQLSRVQQVMNIYCQRAFDDRIAGVFGRVRGEPGQFDTVRLRLDIDERSRRERIYGPVDIDRRAAVDFSIE